jgi:hypothetical protein
MKHLRLIKGAIALIALGITVSGCNTAPQAKDTRPRFNESLSTSVAVEFYKWDNFFITKPDYREGGYRRPLQTDLLDNALNELNIQKDLAVVVLGWNYDAPTIAKIVTEWKSILGERGFKRVVWLRANENNKLDGKVIIEDWKQPVETPTQTAQL